MTQRKTNAKHHTQNYFSKPKDPLDWLVRHCSPDTIVNHPNLTYLYGDQSDITGECSGRTIMDWCRLRQQSYHR